MTQKRIPAALETGIILVVLFLIVFGTRMTVQYLPGVSASLQETYRDENGQPYLTDMDSYYHMRLTEDMADHGYFGDTLKDGGPWDMHSLSPTGRSAEYTPGIAVVTLAFQKLFSLSLSKAAFWIGAVISALAVIPAYLFVRRETNLVGGVTAAFAIGLGRYYFSRTVPGIFDTDMFSLLMPLCAIYFLVGALRTESRFRQILFAALSALFVALFSLCWSGYVFTVAVMLVFLVVFILVRLIWFRADKTWVPPVITFVVLGVGLMVVCNGPGVLVKTAQSLFSLDAQLTSTGAAGFPDTFQSVSELSSPKLLTGGLSGAFLIHSGSSTKGVLNGIGGITVFIAACLGVIGLVYAVFGKKGLDDATREQQRSAAGLYLPLFLVWLVAAILAVRQGQRFISMLSLPVGLLAGLFAGKLWTRLWSKQKAWRVVVAAAMILVLWAPPVAGAVEACGSAGPSVSDPYFEAMDWVKNNTPEDTVVASWWDYGYLFAWAGDRQVVFDGGTQSGERVYWMALAMMTDDPELSAGILRMLANGGSQPTDLLIEKTGSADRATTILREILPLTKAEAQQHLTGTYGLDTDTAEEILAMTHPDDPRPIVFVLSKELLNIEGWWTYFANWNFASQTGKNYDYATQNASVELTPGESGDILVLRQGEAYGYAVVQRGSGDTPTSADFQVKNANGDAYLSNGKAYTPGVNRVVVVEDEKVVRNEVIDADSHYSLFVTGRDGKYSALVVNNSSLANAMFSQLFLAEGDGQSIFKKDWEGYGNVSSAQVWQVCTENTKAYSGNKGEVCP